MRPVSVSPAICRESVDVSQSSSSSMDHSLGGGVGEGVGVDELVFACGSGGRIRVDSSCELQAVITKNSSRIVLTSILRVMLAFLQSHGWSTDTAFYTKAGTARPTGVGLVDCVRTVTVAYGPPCRGVGRWWLYVSGNREARLSPGLLTSGSVALGYLPVVVRASVPPGNWFCCAV